MMFDAALGAPITGRVIARLLLHVPPDCCHSKRTTL